MPAALVCSEPKELLFHFAFEPGRTSYDPLEGGLVMKAFLIIAVALGMFGAAAVAMGRHQHHTHNAYADLQRR
jgi:hypothetical protein